MTYAEIRNHLDNPRTQGIDDLPRFLRGPYVGPTTCPVCDGRGESTTGWRDPGGTGTYAMPCECPLCNGTGTIVQDAEADRALEAEERVHGWGWTVWIDGTEIGWTHQDDRRPREADDPPTGLTTAELRARLPMKQALETFECAECRGYGTIRRAPDFPELYPACENCDGLGCIPVVTRKEPDPTPGPGDPCWCTGEYGELQRHDRRSCTFCDHTGIIQPPGDGTPPDSWDADRWSGNEAFVRGDEFRRREDACKRYLGPCWVLCHPVNDDVNWCTTDSLTESKTTELLIEQVARRRGYVML